MTTFYIFQISELIEDSWILISAAFSQPQSVSLLLLRYMMKIWSHTEM